MEAYKCRECGKVFESYKYIVPSPFEKSHYPNCPKCGLNNVEKY